jgi:hypothetical protein
VGQIGTMPGMSFHKWIYLLFLVVLLCGLLVGPILLVLVYYFVLFHSSFLFSHLNFDIPKLLENSAQPHLYYVLPKFYLATLWLWQQLVGKAPSIALW